ncbi:MAG: LysR family transcriptional regulator [Rhodobacteraceae bacterium]|nr:LysR family transcriptional regulator [Paracoccaceae bacterium]
MSRRRYTPPSNSALVAFEAAARLQGFARAAAELNTSQPAISRHIRNLEIRFGTRLFDRRGQRITLTRKGRAFYAAVVQSMTALQDAIEMLVTHDRDVTIACSHSVSHLLLMPRFAHLRRTLGSQADLRLLTVEYTLLDAAINSGADIIFEYTSAPPKEPYVVVCREEVKPVGTPGIIEQAHSALTMGVAAPPLLRLQKTNYGWMDWSDWCSAHPDFGTWPEGEEFDSYVYLLDAAVRGSGLALGWRGFVEHYIMRGDLAALPGAWYSKDTRIIARATRPGQNTPAVRKCLHVLGNLTEN